MGRRWPAPVRAGGGRLYSGEFISYNPERGYGFIRCTEISEVDGVYFNRNVLPPDVQGKHRSAFAGKRVDFELLVTVDGKPRAERIWLRDPIEEGMGRKPMPPPQPPQQQQGQRERGHKRGQRDRDAERNGPPPPALEPDVIDAMTRFLEEKGGAMDYGKFSNSFPGVKKSQLADHFVLVPEGPNAGGRWQVTLPGVDPLTPEERATREAEDKDTQAAANGDDVNGSGLEDEVIEDVEPLNLEPSAAVRIVGTVRSWNSRQGDGTVAAQGADEVVLQRADLPLEVQHWRGNLVGAEVTFELGVLEDGRLQAASVNLLLEPDTDMPSGWRVRGLGA